MTPQPTPEQLALLKPTERFAWRVADFVHRRLRPLTEFWNSSVMMFVTWLTVIRRIRVSGLEHVTDLDLDRGLCLMANHRSFWDFFIIGCSMVKWAGFSPSRLMFPVRGAFFYDRPGGMLLNALFSGMAMFPPILRERGRRGWNTYAIQRCVHELRENRVQVGIHPEGKRSMSEDPFEIQKGKVGAAAIALQAPQAQIVPVFVTGVGNDIVEEFRRNWMEPENYPVYVAFGPHLDLAALGEPDSPMAMRKATNVCMAAITELAEDCRRHAARDRVPAQA